MKKRKQEEQKKLTLPEEFDFSKESNLEESLLKEALSLIRKQAGPIPLDDDALFGVNAAGDTRQGEHSLFRPEDE